VVPNIAAASQKSLVWFGPEWLPIMRQNPNNSVFISVPIRRCPTTARKLRFFGLLHMPKLICTSQPIRLVIYRMCISDFWYVSSFHERIGLPEVMAGNNSAGGSPSFPPGESPRSVAHRENVLPPTTHQSINP